ncbi:hypothetical protein [Burkholderia pyrrocinia]|uniref:hypothetical protein n=1 Tax=Burkholderia pyrrocinia TaxID=60550 RepID=UPI001BCEAC69|nr:hypothetical protein [Burkholderia pyrrocinia]QVN23086.1 hypothetical protein JYG32_37305 [Burkholderia pyrrocinia]
MRDADQSPFDVGATVPAATLHCTMPSRNAASTAASMIPVNTMTLSLRAQPHLVEHIRHADATNGRSPEDDRKTLRHERNAILRKFCGE